MQIVTAHPKKFKCGRFCLDLFDRTNVMGILNRTPDSFSDGGFFLDLETAFNHVKQMVADGSDIIDIGGESTRPGAVPVTLLEEMDRTIPLIEKISQNLNIPISIDTSKHEVAKEAIRAGSAMVNDVTGLKRDPLMAKTIASSDAAVCLMHMRGTPRDMQDNPKYDDLMIEVINSLRESIDIAVGAGISRDKIIVDPGIGFGKTVQHNLTIIKEIARLKVLAAPILIGVSKKAFIGEILDKNVDERLMGSISASLFAASGGANIVRVHDVKEMAEAVRMHDAIQGVG